MKCGKQIFTAIPSRILLVMKTAFKSSRFKLFFPLNSKKFTQNNSNRTRNPRKMCTNRRHHRHVEVEGNSCGKEREREREKLGVEEHKLKTC
jgi:hypothetical protein